MEKVGEIKTLYSVCVCVCDSVNTPVRLKDVNDS